jgi:hypothetical protein
MGHDRSAATRGGFFAPIQAYCNVHCRAPMGLVVSAAGGDWSEVLGGRAERGDRQEQQGADDKNSAK